MFAHKITELSFGEKIVKDTVFTHVSKVYKLTYNYKIVDIKLGSLLVNDAIIIEDLNNDNEPFQVEPEWFNQRIKGIKF